MSRSMVAVSVSKDGGIMSVAVTLARMTGVPRFQVSNKHHACKVR